jgi:hypothetical protein
MAIYQGSAHDSEIYARLAANLGRVILPALQNETKCGVSGSEKAIGQQTT